jgi:hypothetical protein
MPTGSEVYFGAHVVRIDGVVTIKKAAALALVLAPWFFACAAKPEAPPPKLEPAREEPPPAVEDPTPPCVKEHVATAACAPYAGTATADATISSKPDADVYWGGKKIGRTPISRRKVSLGCVELLFVTRDGRCVAKQFTVDDGEKLAILRAEL